MRTLRLTSASIGKGCVLCGSSADLTEEDVIPKWMVRAFNARGRVTLTASEEAAEPHETRSLKRFQVTLDDGLCRRCNNELLSRLENEVKPVLGPMAVQCQPTVLSLAAQRLLAVWAIKTVYLMELALLRRYPSMRRVGGYQPSISETGWMLAQLEQYRPELVEPPPRSMVWLACWDVRKLGDVDLQSGLIKGSMVKYVPSEAPLRSPKGGEVVGHFSTLSIGFVVFQVFTVDYIEADAQKAEVWNPGPPPSVAGSIRLIWPHRLRAGEVAWPPLAFPNDNFDRLVTWDMALRRGPDLVRT